MSARKAAAPHGEDVSKSGTIPTTAQARAAESAARKKKPRTAQGTPIFETPVPMPAVKPPREKAGTRSKTKAGGDAGTKPKTKAGAKGKEPTQAEVKEAFRRCTDNLTTAAQAFATLGKRVAAAGEGLPGADPVLPQPRNWRDSDEFRYVRDGILAALRKSGRDTDPLVLDKVDEYMDFWVQRRMLAEDVENRGLMVTDDRGRLQENRSASLGVQVSKQMTALASQLGLIAKAKPAGKTDDTPEEGEEEDEL